MWKLSFIFVAFSVVRCLAHDSDSKSVLVYSSDQFLTEVSKQNHFVMFFAPWCGHCSRLSPTWDQLADKYNSAEKNSVKIAKVDCTVETSLCSEQDVTGYPTLKLFKTGEDEGVKYRGTRDLASLTTFISEQLGIEEPDSVPELPEPVNGLIELTEETFEDHIREGKHFVKFYAPWCGHCQKLAPTWDDLARSFEYDTTVTIAKVDCTVHRSVCNTFDIVGYPTLLWIEDGKKLQKYQGQRTLEDLKSFVSRMLTPSDTTATEQETDTDDNSPIAVLSGENFESGVASGFAFVKFFAPWCGHCKRLAPTWEELGKKFVGNELVRIVKVDCTQEISKDLCNRQEVDGFPTLFLYKNGEKIEEYNGSRSLDDLYEFVLKHLPHDEL
ncbi:Thioredoxin domain-containing protein 5 homolog [Gryllus bimaculatus]|nr:Thioredoxin domain-containing protein 5 homolog [Gryllus bimaculatus]